MCGGGNVECVADYLDRVKSVNKEADELSNLLKATGRVPLERIAKLYETIGTVQQQFAVATIRTGGEALRKECMASAG